MSTSRLLKLILLIVLVSSTQGWLWSSSKTVEEEAVDEKKAEQETTTSGSNSRVNGHEHKLSEQAHFVDSDKDGKYEHNSEYDHEAFLGKDEAEQFKSMTPEESKAKLGEIIDKIDADKDDFLTLNELNEWIKNLNQKYIKSDVEERWHHFQNKNTLDEYLSLTYGALENWSEEEKNSNKEDYKTYIKMLERDKKKFKAADHNKDGKLDKKEYTDFLHPEESAAMREIVIDETLEDLDENEDGVINIEEFIKDFYDETESNGAEPEWVKLERANFVKVRDVNKDNVLDREELANWILPKDFDQSLSEAQHLIHEADSDKDGKLSKKEVLENYSVFVSSTATNHGADLYEHQDL